MSEPAADFASRASLGRQARARAPRSTSEGWAPVADRFDPVALLEEQALTRVPDLVPVRHGRMMVSPFTFYRGAALIMAADLSTMANSGLTVQLCGDAHLSNFGLFGTPERRLSFDINDFDETHPGPFEWDVLRLAASIEIAGRDRGFPKKDRRATVRTAVSAYRQRMRALAGASVLDAWYDHLDIEQVLAWIRSERKAHRATDLQVRTADEIVAKARTRTSTRAVAKLVEKTDGGLRIRSDPPLVVPIEDLVTEGGPFGEVEETMRRILRDYRSTLPQQHHPLDEFTYLHTARKVVGVGSVGTRAWILLLQGRDSKDPLLLQAKEAQRSVLERYLEPSEYDNQGERVVRGQRLMQASGDIFLGWQRVTGVDGEVRDFYVRQLHDWKGAVDVDSLQVPGAHLYARLCGEALARAHARSGDRVAIASYLGASSPSTMPSSTSRHRMPIRTNATTTP